MVERTLLIMLVQNLVVYYRPCMRQSPKSGNVKVSIRCVKSEQNPIISYYFLLKRLNYYCYYLTPKKWTAFSTMFLICFMLIIKQRINFKVNYHAREPLNTATNNLHLYLKVRDFRFSSRQRWPHYYG